MLGPILATSDLVNFTLLLTMSKKLCAVLQGIGPAEAACSQAGIKLLLLVQMAATRCCRGTCEEQACANREGRFCRCCPMDNGNSCIQPPYCPQKFCAWHRCWLPSAKQTRQVKNRIHTKPARSSLVECGKVTIGLDASHRVQNPAIIHPKYVLCTLA